MKMDISIGHFQQATYVEKGFHQTFFVTWLAIMFDCFNWFALSTLHFGLPISSVLLEA